MQRTKKLILQTLDVIAGGVLVFWELEWILLDLQEGVTIDPYDWAISAVYLLTLLGLIAGRKWSRFAYLCWMDFTFYGLLFGMFAPADWDVVRVEDYELYSLIFIFAVMLLCCYRLLLDQVRARSLPGAPTEAPAVSP